MSPGKKLIYAIGITGLAVVMLITLFTACDDRSAVNPKVSTNSKVTITLSQSNVVVHSLTEPDTVAIELRVRDAEGTGLDSVQVSLFRAPEIGTISPPGLTSSGGFTTAYFITDPGSVPDTTMTFIAKSGNSADTATMRISYSPASVIMTLSPPVLTVHSATSPDSAKINIVVRDENGNGISEERVELTRYPQVGTMVDPLETVENGSTSSWFITDIGSSGEDTLITFIASSSAGVDTATLIIDYAFPIVSMNLIPPELIVKSKDKPDTVEINIRVRDANGIGIDSVQVNLSRKPDSLGTIVAPALTADGGFASAKYITDTGFEEAYDVIITATANTMVDVDTLSVKFSLQGEIDTINVSLEKTTLIADGVDKANIYISVLDTTGVPLEGAKVYIENYGATIPGVLDSVSATTYNGFAIVSIKAPPLIDSMAVVDADTIHVFSQSQSNIIKHTYVPIYYVPGEPNTLLITTIPVPMIAGSGDAQNISVRVTDAQGSLVRDGTQIRFRKNLQASDITPITTTSHGYATAVYTVGTESGLDEVTAFYTKPGTIDTTLSEPMSIEIASSAPTNIALKALNPTIAVGGLSTIVQATMQDENGNPLSDGWEIEFEIVQAPSMSGPGCPSFRYASTEGDSLLLTTEVTNVNGIAAVSLFSGTISGTVTIKVTAAYDENIFKQKNLITIESGPPYEIQIEASNLAEVVGEEIKTGITASVWDMYTNPVEPLTAVHFMVIPDTVCFINGAAYTGGYPNPDDPEDTIGVKGLASTWMYYGSYDTFDTVRVRAESGGMVDTSGPLILAIYSALLSIDPIPGVLYCQTSGDTATSQIVALLQDGLFIPISKGIILFTNSGCGYISGQIQDTTGEDGYAGTWFTIKYDQIPQIPPNPPQCVATVTAKLRGYPDIEGECSINCYRPAL